MPICIEAINMADYRSRELLFVHYHQSEKQKYGLDLREILNTIGGCVVNARCSRPSEGLRMQPRFFLFPFKRK